MKSLIQSLIKLLQKERINWASWNHALEVPIISIVSPLEGCVPIIQALELLAAVGASGFGSCCWFVVAEFWCEVGNSSFPTFNGS